MFFRFFALLSLVVGFSLQTANAASEFKDPPNRFSTTVHPKAVSKAVSEATSNELQRASAGVPSYGCRAGFVQQGDWLCMTGAQGPAQYDNAALYCQDIGGRVADITDWRYRIFRGDGVPAPVGWWLGPRTNDNTALYVNQANIGDFDGEASVFNWRYYACVHDIMR